MTNGSRPSTRGHPAVNIPSLVLMSYTPFSEIKTSILHLNNNDPGKSPLSDIFTFFFPILPRMHQYLSKEGSISILWTHKNAFPREFFLIAIYCPKQLMSWIEKTVQVLWFFSQSNMNVRRINSNYSEGNASKNWFYHHKCDQLHHGLGVTIISWLFPSKDKTALQEFQLFRRIFFLVSIIPPRIHKGIMV